MLTQKLVALSSSRQAHARNSCGLWTPNPCHAFVRALWDTKILWEQSWVGNPGLLISNARRVSKKSLSNLSSSMDIYQHANTSATQTVRGTSFEPASCCEIHRYILNITCMHWSRLGAMVVTISLAFLACIEARRSRIQHCHGARMTPRWGPLWVHEKDRGDDCASKKDQKTLGQICWSSSTSALNVEKTWTSACSSS